MEDRVPEFIQNATNVYRTKNYIVRQDMGIQYGCAESTEVFSRDTFYVRTPERDRAYELLFFRRRQIDGKRLPTTMYARTYRK